MAAHFGVVGEYLFHQRDLAGALGRRSHFLVIVRDALAQRLYALYDYMCARLLHANAHNDRAALEEVSHLLGELKDAWEEIRQKLSQGAPM